MRDLTMKGKHRKIRGKKQPHLSILTLDDLNKNNWKHSLLITQLQARYQALKEPGKGKPNQTSEDF
ncbi:MAG: hypothetical protein A2W35_10010 [Chloroflexi bacterium RBG_16_57_11]|nr:MAG: hypothetical protein A2W35_10010 [Chloroflexi bacterium RBG_16_57_11]